MAPAMQLSQLSASAWSIGHCAWKAGMLMLPYFSANRRGPPSQPLKKHASLSREVLRSAGCSARRAAASGRSSISR